MQAIVLAGGEGRRLRPLTAHRPKVMLPIGGRPILEHVVRALTANKVTDITIVTGYFREKVQTHFQDGDAWGATIRYAHQERQLGTGHALSLGFDEAQPDGPFLVLPGDNYVTAGLVKLLIAAKGDAALATTNSANPSQYGVVHMAGDRISKIEEKPAAPKTRLISTGIYKLPASIRDQIDGAEGLALTDAVNHALAAGLKMTSVPTEDAWLDVVYPWDLLRANHRVLQELSKPKLGGTREEGVVLQGPIAVGEGTILRAGCYIVGPVQIGADCDIGPNAVIRGPATLGDRVRIAPFSDLENVSIFDDALIDTGAVLRHTILDQGARLGPRVSADRGPSVFDIEGDLLRVDTLGAVVGTDAILGADVVLSPGAVIGNGARVAPQRTVHRVPDKGVVA